MESVRRAVRARASHIRTEVASLGAQKRGHFAQQETFHPRQGVPFEQSEVSGSSDGPGGGDFLRVSEPCSRPLRSRSGVDLVEARANPVWCAIPTQVASLGAQKPGHFGEGENGVRASCRSSSCVANSNRGREPRSSETGTFCTAGDFSSTPGRLI